MAEEMPLNTSISRHMVEELVRSSGDQIVSGYFRNRKIRPCKGYGEAKRKAAFRLSAIKGGRMTSDGHCYVQIAYHRTVLILPVLILICLVCSNLMTIKGITRAVQPILPDSLLEELTSPEHMSLPYLQVPGYKDLVFTGESHVMKFSNPPDNLYGLKFQVFIKDQVVAESGILSPGEEENGDFYQLLEQGYYEITIKATGYGMKNEQEYNTVVQNVTLKVE